MKIHIPAAARRESQTDAHLTVVDQCHGWEYDLWAVSVDNLIPPAAAS